jgi:fatty acid desaturase
VILYIYATWVLTFTHLNVDEDYDMKTERIVLIAIVLLSIATAYWVPAILLLGVFALLGFGALTGLYYIHQWKSYQKATETVESIAESVRALQSEAEKNREQIQRLQAKTGLIK